MLGAAAGVKLFLRVVVENFMRRERKKTNRRGEHLSWDLNKESRRAKMGQESVSLLRR